MFIGSKNYHMHEVNTYFYIIVVGMLSLLTKYMLIKKDSGNLQLLKGRYPGH